MASRFRLSSVSVRVALLIVVPIALCSVLLGGFYLSTSASSAGYSKALLWRDHAIAMLQLRGASTNYIGAVEQRKADPARYAMATAQLTRAAEDVVRFAALFDEEEQEEDEELAGAIAQLIERGSRTAADDHDQISSLRAYLNTSIRTTVEKRVDEELTGSREAAQQGRASAERIMRLAIFAAVLLMVTGLVLCVRLAYVLRRSLGDLTAAAEQIAAGDLDATVSVRGHDELARVGDAFNTMAVNLSDTMVHRSALKRANIELAARGEELEQALDRIRVAQEELMMSSRLAAVGEMAGRTAHEVLNPVQSLHGRLARMANEDVAGFAHNSEVLAAIVDAWREAHAQGMPALLRALAEPVGAGTALDADLNALAELVRCNRDTTARAQEDLEFLNRELARITRIVDGMRKMSRQTSSVARGPLAPIIAETCEILRDTADKRRIALRWSVPDDVVVELDRYELIQVLTNIVRNAMQAIEERHGHGSGNIMIRGTVRGDRVALEIEDDGIGIAEEHVPMLFDTSFTTRSASEGTGLGLGIARRLVRHMNGEIVVAQTAVGVGTTFVINLPLASSAMPQPERHADFPVRAA
jgi:signal transduction histidine kinase